MSEAKMKMATMSSSTSYPAWFGWHKIASRQKLAAQEMHHDNCQNEVNRGEDNERCNQSRHGCYSFASPHYAINYPRLATQFGYDPSGFNPHESQRTGHNQTSQKPSVIGETPVFQPQHIRTKRQHEHQHART